MLIQTRKSYEPREGLQIANPSSFCPQLVKQKRPDFYLLTQVKHYETRTSFLCWKTSMTSQSRVRHEGCDGTLWKTCLGPFEFQGLFHRAAGGNIKMTQSGIPSSEEQDELLTPQIAPPICLSPKLVPAGVPFLLGSCIPARACVVRQGNTRTSV